MEKTFKCYIMEDANALQLKEKLNTMEAQLAEVRQLGGSRAGE